MPATLPTVLGIDPGARQIGVSVLRGEELVFYAVKSFKKRNQEETFRKLRKVLGKLIAEYRIECVAIEKIAFVQQDRSFVKNVYQEITNFIKKQNVEFYEYHPKFVRQIVCGAAKPTKRTAALMLSQRYTELVRYFAVPKLWQKRYFALLFDAIAVGLVCAKEINEIKLLSKNNQLVNN